MVIMAAHSNGQAIIFLPCGFFYLLLLVVVPSGMDPAYSGPHTLRPFYDRTTALTQEGRSLVNDVCECVHD